MQIERYVTIEKEELIEILENHFKEKKVSAKILEVHVHKNGSGVKCLVE